MSVMAALAGRTKRIKFGVNVLSLAMRDAVLVARQCATIDFLSNGRLLPAFGIGSPLGAGMDDPEPRPQDARPQDRRRPGGDPPAVVAGQGRFRGRALSFIGRVDLAEAGAARSADVDRRLVRGGDQADRADRHRLAGRARKRRTQAAKVVAAIKAACRRGGRTIDDDHYGAGIPFRFGAARRARRSTPLFDAYRKRTGRDPQRLFRDRRRRGDRRQDRRLRRGGRLEIHPAPGGQGRRRDAWRRPAG